MPNLAAPAGATPSILSLLTPVAASPIAPVEGAPGPSFADIVAGLTVPPEVPPTAVPPGQTLPVERPELAASIPAPIDETDPLLSGCGWSPEILPPAPQTVTALARFDPVEPALRPAPMTQPRVIPEAAAEPDLSTPACEVFRSPLRTAVLASAPQAVIARATQPGPVAAPELQVAEDDVAPGTREQVEPELATGAIPNQPEAGAAPIPMPMPVPVPVPVPAAQVALAPVAPEGMQSPEAELVAPAQAPSIAATRPAPTAPVEAPAAAIPSLQSISDPQRDAQQQQQPQPQPQPQPKPKPVLAPAAPIELRIAPDLARQVAQMIQPALERVAEPQPVPAMPVDAAAVSAIPAPQPVAAPAPVQPATFQSAPVDLGRAGWADAMIERIAEMPQVDRREAQIKLLPDMLGKVEVTLVERDERVHVTLNAETVQARQLLSEAAPRLQELAEARGLRLAQTQIGGGASQDRRSPQDQNQPQTPLRPRSAQAEQADDHSTPDGERIA